MSKSKKKLQSEFDDINVLLENERSKFSAIDKKQKKFDQSLAEEKAISERLTLERDNLERDLRERETKILNLSRQIDELNDSLSETNRVKGQLQRELDDLVSSKDDVGKNVSK